MLQIEKAGSVGIAPGPLRKGQKLEQNYKGMVLMMMSTM